MDPVANVNRQREIAQEIINLIDAHTRDDGVLPAEAAQEVADYANELAELALALDNWRRGGGYDPYAASNN